MDERLRRLERETRVRHDDTEAGRAFARALEQVGDERGAWREWCRLARELWDDLAWERLEWRPVGVVSGTRPLAKARVSGGSLARVVEPGDAPCGQELLVLQLANTVVLDPRELRERWSRPCGRGAAPVRCGPFLAMIDASSAATVLIVDAASGAEVARLQGLHPVEALGATLDRLVVWSVPAPGRRITRVVDCGTRPGGTVLEVEGGDRSPAPRLVSAGLRLSDDSRRVTAWPIDGADALWTRERCRLLASDWRGVLLLSFTPERDELVEVDAGTGVERWRVPLLGNPRKVEVVLAGGLALCAEEGRERLRAIERFDGRVRWEWEPGRRFHWTSLPVARDALYVGFDGTFPRLIGIDLLDGGTLFEHAPHASKWRDVSVVPMDGAFLVVNDEYGGVLVKRQG